MGIFRFVSFRFVRASCGYKLKDAKNKNASKDNWERVPTMKYPVLRALKKSGILKGDAPKLPLLKQIVLKLNFN